MKFFMNEQNVDKYIDMVKEYDASWIVNKLKDYLPKGSSLLELGMGPGKDLELIAKDYKVVGSDNSQVFIDKFNEKNNGIEAIYVDAIEMNIDRKFDCIYSNKVLHHLTKKDFIKSIENQKKNLNPEGIIFMTLWKGEHKEEMMFNDEVRFTYYLEDDIKEIAKNKFDIVVMETYTECETDDSLLVVLKRK